MAASKSPLRSSTPHFVAPTEYWDLHEGEPPQHLPGRRAAGYWYRDPRAGVQGPAGSRGVWREMPLVNTIRARLDEWRTADRPGISRITAESLGWRERDDRSPRLFYAQMEAVETIVFLTETRADFLTGLTIPRDDPGEERHAQGHPGFERRCCKMATGTGKSTAAAMQCWRHGRSSTSSTQYRTPLRWACRCKP